MQASGKAQYGICTSKTLGGRSSLQELRTLQVLIIAGAADLASVHHRRTCGPEMKGDVEPGRGFFFLPDSEIVFSTAIAIAEVKIFMFNRKRFAPAKLGRTTVILCECTRQSLEEQLSFCANVSGKTHKRNCHFARIHPAKLMRITVILLKNTLTSR